MPRGRAISARIGLHVFHVRVAAQVATGCEAEEVPVAVRALQPLGRAVAEPRFNLQLLSAFAVVGLLLALVGVWGLTAFDVRRRFGEIGIRLSLGARPEGILSKATRVDPREVLNAE